jgi:hypothetical protein
MIPAAYSKTRSVWSAAAWRRFHSFSMISNATAAPGRRTPHAPRSRAAWLSRWFCQAVKLTAMKVIVCALLIVFGTLPVCGQNFQRAKVQIDFDKLADKADEVVEVNVEARTLRLAAKFLKDSDPEEAAVKALLNGLQGVYVRVYQFDKANQYAASDIDGVRAQLSAPNWSRMVSVISKREAMKVEVHTMYEGEQMLGLTIIAAEPKELVFVNIVGPIDIDRLAQLSDKLGLPRLELKDTGNRKSHKQ